MSNHNGDAANIRPAQLAAYALGQLEGEELAAVERYLGEPAHEHAHRAFAEMRRLAEAVRAAATSSESSPDRSLQLRAAVLAQLEKQSDQPVEPPRRLGWNRRAIAWLAVGSAAAVLAAAIALPAMQSARNSARRAQAANDLKQSALALHNYHDSIAAHPVDAPSQVERQLYRDYIADELPALADTIGPKWGASAREPASGDPVTSSEIAPLTGSPAVEAKPKGFGDAARPNASGYIVRNPVTESRMFRNPQGELGGTDAGRDVRDEATEELRSVLQSEQVTEFRDLERLVQTTIEPEGWAYGSYGREQYERIVENRFLSPAEHPLSTFSIDVDTASYSNVRRFLTSGRLPPPNAVRIEELVNYFQYSYPQPKAGEPFSVTMHSTQCPWQPGNLLLRVGLAGKEIHKAERPASNLVFLLDVSGSMSDQNKLPLLKTALELFVAELTENDRVSIVTYAGEAGLRLPPTSGDQQRKILDAIQSLSVGGSTHGSAGIQLAYEQAGQYFLKEGANRVILATDGDLNVGITQDDALVELIKGKAAGGTFLTVLGFGEGNLQDAKLEKLADNGNGLYAYIDSVREARKVLVEQMSGSTVAIAKDVKIQIEFNPREVAAYRLLGYENRVLAAKDFSDDSKDAGEIGAGHTVTALYELVPAGTRQAAAAAVGGEPLKYQESGAVGNALRGVPETEDRRQETAKLTDAAKSGELLTLKLRYKEPDGQASKLLEVPHKDRGGPFNAASKDLQFAAAVASFGMILRGSEHKGGGTLSAASEIASSALGEDPGGYRAEFVDLVRRAQALGAK